MPTNKDNLRFPGLVSIEKGRQNGNDIPTEASLPILEAETLVAMYNKNVVLEKIAN